MNQLNRNRLIGGSVLLFAGLLFAPMILTPPETALTNPTLAVRIDSDNPLAKPSQGVVLSTAGKEDNTPAPVPTVAPQPSVQLESIAKAPKVATIPANNLSADAKNRPVVLESTAAIGNNKPSKVTTSNKPSKAATSNKPSKAATSNSKPSKTVATSTASWVRVGSFASKANAKKLANKLKKQYAVNIETIKVDGKDYRRVLIGPFATETKLQAAIKAMRNAGYQPSVQR